MENMPTQSAQSELIIRTSTVIREEIEWDPVKEARVGALYAKIRILERAIEGLKYDLIIAKQDLDLLLFK